MYALFLSASGLRYQPYQTNFAGRKNDTLYTKCSEHVKPLSELHKFISCGIISVFIVLQVAVKMCAELLLKYLTSASSSQDYLQQERSIKPLFSRESSCTFGQNPRRFLRWCGMCVCVCGGGDIDGNGDHRIVWHEYAARIHIRSIIQRLIARLASLATYARLN